MKKIVLLTLLTTSVFSCVSTKDDIPSNENMLVNTASVSDSSNLDTVLGEKLFPNESKLTNDIENALIQGLEKEYASGTVKRDAHAKHHGCVTATFKVNNMNLDPRLKVGVFAENNKEYKAWIRFSNGRSFNDTEADVRGMAIKLMNVSGQKLLKDEATEQTQDFLMINNSAMFINDLNDYVALSQASASGNVPKFLITHPSTAYRIYKATSHKIDSPLNSDYFSTTPYKLGDSSAIKFKVSPCGGAQNNSNYEKTPDYLRTAMSNSLSKKDSCFDFMVQTRKGSLSDMPIEDATVDWSPEKSPFVSVAKIFIPKQNFTSKAQMDFCEDISYTPWHSLAEHKPLGSLNRVRKEVYTTISKFRHSKNNTIRKEPTDWNIGRR